MIYGIDFGTSNSLLAAARKNEIISPIPLDPEHTDPTILRSLLYFPNMQKVYYGTEAIQRFTENQGEGRLIRSIKKQLPIRSFLGTWIEDRPVNLEDLIGFFAAELRRRANAYFKLDVESAVVGRPARFSMDDAEDRFAEFRLREAFKRGGFKHIEFCPEPIAAAYAFKKEITEPKIVLVADFGGGTSDFTVIRLSKAPYNPQDVLSLGGVSVAGDAIDGAVMRDHLSPQFGAGIEYKVPFGSNVLRMPIHLMERLCSPADISFLVKRDVNDFLQNIKKWATSPKDRERMDRLFALINDQLGFAVFEEIESAKRRLTTDDNTKITLPQAGIEIEQEISRPLFEDSIHPQLSSILTCLDEVVKMAGIKPSQIDLVCSTGGTAKVPLLRKELISRFGQEKVQAHNHFHSVVEGLAQVAKDLNF